MEADYGDVVPRRDFERLEAQFTVSNVNLKRSVYSGDPELLGIETYTGGTPLVAGNNCMLPTTPKGS